MIKKNITIIGGGLAGLTLALHLLNSGIAVTVIEKSIYPRHKVCGEYISNEVINYWKSLGICPFLWGAINIDTLSLSNSYGNIIKTPLPLGGFGISRYVLDENIYKLVISAGATFLHEQVNMVNFKNNLYDITLASGKVLVSDIVIGSFGKRSNLDISLSRKFIKSPSPWLGVKMHYDAPWESNKVGLYNFKGGYCGISQVEDKKINVCYLAEINSFKKYKDIDSYREEVLFKNPHLKRFFKEAIPLFKKPITISQISFDKKKLVHDHILMCGDSASLIHPLCGNGMAMAVMGAKILAEEIIEHLSQNTLRAELEYKYVKSWKASFNYRLRTGRVLQSVLNNERATNWGMGVLRYTPSLFKRLIKSTHGNTTAI